jgi:membrane protein
MSTENRPCAMPAALMPEDPGAWMGMKGRLFGLLRFCYLVKAGFTLHQGALRAAALTYTTILSLVPVLAIAFAVLKGLGAQNTLEPVLQRLAGDSQETISRIVAYVNNTNFKSVGAIGLLVLVVTVISLLENIEMAFNTIWGVRETRSLQRRFSDYLSVVVVGPILILVATSMTTSLQNQWVVKWLLQHEYLGEAVLSVFRLSPYVSVWIALIFLYIYIPNTRVRFRSALLGGILAGTAWQMAQWAYFYFQVGVANYNAIYGTLAALPVFLVWVYTSWLIVLLGLEIVCIHQRRRHVSACSRCDTSSPAAREERVLALLLQVCRHFRENGPPPGAERLANELALGQDQVEEGLEALDGLGYLVQTAGSEPGWLPAREPSDMEISVLLAGLRGSAASNDASPAAMLLAADIIRRDAHSSRLSLEALTLHDLLVAQERGTGVAPYMTL